MWPSRPYFERIRTNLEPISLLARRAGGLGRPLRSPRVAPMIPNDRISFLSRSEGRRRWRDRAGNVAAAHAQGIEGLQAI